MSGSRPPPLPQHPTTHLRICYIIYQNITTIRSTWYPLSHSLLYNPRRQAVRPHPSCSSPLPLRHVYFQNCYIIYQNITTIRCTWYSLSHSLIYNLRRQAVGPLPSCNSSPTPTKISQLYAAHDIVCPILSSISLDVRQLAPTPPAAPHYPLRHVYLHKCYIIYQNITTICSTILSVPFPRL